MKYLIAIILASCNAQANEPLRITGDWLQILNPVVAGIASTQEHGALHFGGHFAQSMAMSGIFKYAGKRLKPPLARRPNCESYNGMPSGHTMSSWSAASYSRIYSDVPYLTPALYASAVVTGASRVISKRHTLAQVIAAVVLSEALMELNSHVGWLEGYVRYDLDVFSTGVQVKF